MSRTPVSQFGPRGGWYASYRVIHVAADLEALRGPTAGKVQLPLDLDASARVSSKVTAMVGRRAPRDFIDVAAALDHGYSRADLMRLAFARDPGLRVEDLTLAVRQLDQLALEDFSEYGVDAQGLEELRSRFADWPRREADDQEGHAVHATVAEEEQRNRGASSRPSSATLAGQAYPPTGRTTLHEGHAPGSRPPPEAKPPHRSP